MGPGVCERGASGCPPGSGARHERAPQVGIDYVSHVMGLMTDHVIS